MRHYAASVAAVVCFLGLAANTSGFAVEQPVYAEFYNPAGIRDDGVYVDKLLAKSIQETNRRGPVLAGNFPEGRVEKVKVKADAFTEVNELFYKRGWTDGLPIVVPTPEKVERMLRGTDLDPKFVVAELDPMNGKATIEKIAVNAVMAGCKPEHMPVLIAAVTALADPDVDLRGYATTTSPDTTLLIFTGPIIGDIDLNADTNTMGRGRRANSTIGRAIQLMINNIGGSWPGITDMSSLGSPAEYGWVIAENASANPWTSLNLDVGIPKNASAVTVMGAEGMRGVIGSGQSSEGFLKLIADHMVGLAAQRPHWPMVLLVIAKDTAAQLARDGWTKETIREAVLGFVSVPSSRPDAGPKLGRELPAGGNADPHAPKTQTAPLQIDQFLILVAGGTGEKTMIIPGWLGAARAVSKEIRLPGRWQEIKNNGE